MHKKLLIPGPTEVSEEMLGEQGRFLIGHRTKEFSELYTGIIEKLNGFFQLPDSYKPGVTTSSGTLWFDIVGRSLVKEKALACTNGAFSERFGKAIQACGKKVDFLEVEWGKAVKPEMIMEKLGSGDYDTLAVCHNETSTGVRNPIYKIGKMVRRDYPDLMIAIDSISGMVGDKTLPSEIDCDVIFASTQKCFALPPGLAVGIVSDRALERARELPSRGLYTDMVRIFEYYERKHQTPFTPNISLLYALDKRMDLLLEQTPEGVYQRHKAMAEYTRNWAKKYLGLFAEPGYESVTVTCIKNTLGKSVKELNEKLAEKHFMISNGYGKLAEQTFRIGHMGEWNLEGIKEVLQHINEIWGLGKENGV
ncbi:alanine--glyoxylate aminotransferase family protein [Candidatus Bathyarchaeota archaeon]|nr:alanine--glyoxylate aminotransferase family protein [Candidatus Bathyarchaeota archaeon]MCK4668621.1 alanine--glyoxylate aminotransferase family protein [Candidatus Bathyarchaeota archaeon]